MTNLGHTFKTTIGGREVTVEIGKYAEQASSCFMRCGDTVVMVNATMSEEPRPGMDYFPLGVDFEEKMYSVGKIPGGFKKREGRAGDKAILTSRLIDRPIRPLFPDGFFNDVSVVATALSVDPDIPPEVFGMIGSSVVLSISDIPFNGPTGSVVVGLVDGEFVINPDTKQREKSLLHLVVSGTKEAIMMVEAGSNEISEEQMLAGILFGHEEIKKQVAFIEEIVKAIGKPKRKIDFYSVPEGIEKQVRDFAEKLFAKVFAETDRQKRQEAEATAEKEVYAYFSDKLPDNKREIGDVMYDIKKEIVRAKITNEGFRPDGRKLTEIRPIWCETGLLPRVHGSAVFTRGQTQALTTCTLGMALEAQRLDTLDPTETSKRYMHHYNFPGYSTGEAKPMRAPGRREIGHGALAERALEAVIPSETDFPYAIRTVTEVISSNGSTSQASVCGSTLALMDAGVPIKAPVAGIAMGLIKDEKTKNVAILSDIQGLEDFLGDMDFKVAGTKDGITAIQMDIKISGIDEQILKTALAQAKEGRMHILGEMLKVLPAPKEEMSKYAPKIIMFQIDPEKIGEVIGKSGKTINAIIEETGVKMDIEDDGRVFIATADSAMAERAKKIVLSIVEEPEPGMIFEGKVVRVLEFGAFVNISPGRDGMVHISKLDPKKRVEKVTDIVNIGDMVEVAVIKVDEKGRIDLRLNKKI
ncbi:MAG: polyribonucleotide nucleotidyltransferase [Firmicutes bacterium]|nr:polyribonucleotide nucleotidyltransferase [Bacillota bacterium]